MTENESQMMKDKELNNEKAEDINKNEEFEEEEEEEEEYDSFEPHEDWTSEKIATKIQKFILIFIEGRKLEIRCEILLRYVEKLLNLLVKHEDYTNEEIKNTFNDIKLYEPDSYNNFIQIVDNRKKMDEDK